MSQKFYTDPLNIASLESFALSLLQASPRRELANWHALPGPDERHALERLPIELLDHICSYLPARSVIALNRSSKALAQKVPLDDPFWRRSLMNGTLLPHIWDLNGEDLSESAHETTRNWNRVAQLLSQRKFPISGLDPRLRDIPDALWNRCRIWSIVEEAVEAYFRDVPS